MNVQTFQWNDDNWGDEITEVRIAFESEPMNEPWEHWGNLVFQFGDNRVSIEGIDASALGNIGRMVIQAAERLAELNARLEREEVDEVATEEQKQEHWRTLPGQN